MDTAQQTAEQKFMQLAAAWNCDIECDCPFSESDIIKMHEPRGIFGGEEVESHNGLRLFRRADFQIRKGLRRGDIYEIDFGDFRLIAFTGEGVIKD
jgi:hypothetical protein